MAAELGLLSLTHPQKLAQFQQKQQKLQQQQQQQQQQLNPSSTTDSWMWSTKQAAQEDDDDSWEVRAFAEDTGNVMGTTWPPRSYTCTFCRREFRSAQALGGHMNVHRRDRAKLHQSQPGSASATASTTSSSTLIIPTQELVANGGLCLLYSIPNPNGIFSPTTINGCMESPSTLLSVTPYPNNLMTPCAPPVNFPVGPHSINSSLCHSSNTEPSASISDDNNHEEELDLELRLGRRRD